MGSIQSLLVAREYGSGSALYDWLVGASPMATNQLTWLRTNRITFRGSWPMRMWLVFYAIKKNTRNNRLGHTYFSYRMFLLRVSYRFKNQYFECRTLVNSLSKLLYKPSSILKLLNISYVPASHLFNECDSQYSWLCGARCWILILGHRGGLIQLYAALTEKSRYSFQEPSAFSDLSGYHSWWWYSDTKKSKTWRQDQ